VIQAVHLIAAPVGGAPRGDYAQGERYITKEHMAGIVPYNPLHFLHPWRSDVLRDWFGFARPFKSIAARRASHRCGPYISWKGKGLLNELF